MDRKCISNLQLELFYLMEKYTDLSTKLGRGSFGSVRLIQRNADMKLLAMKEIELATEDAAKNAYNESHFLERLQHPNIVKFYETFVQKECLYLIMEYCEQGDLQKKIKEATASEEYFPEQQVLEWFTQVCMAVKQLHDNHVIHRDIKVHNTFLNSEGMVKLGDFGISKQLDHTADLGKTWLGTPFYVSPEMLSHSISSYKSDIWMLGCLLHELCTLEKPFFGDNIPTVINKILYDNYSPVPEHYSSFVHTLIASLLDKNAEKRPSIDAILEIPEIQEEVEKLRLKYPEVYTTKSSSLVARGHAEQAVNRPSPNLVAKRWTSATIVPQKVEEKVTKEIENSKDGNLNSTWDLYDQSQSMTPQSKSTNSKQGAHNGAMNSQETLKSAVPDQKRKPNSIRALVEQKKAILSPSNCEKLSHINSSAMAGQITNQSFSSFLDNNNNQKPQGPCQEQVHNVTVHPLKLSNIHIDEHDPTREDKKAPFMKLNSLDKINKQSSEEYGLIDKYQEAREAAKESPCPIKTMEGSTKKHHNLSINIPTSSEHGGDSPAQVKTEKALPAKMRTAMNEMGDPNVVPTTKVGAKKSFAFSNYLFDQKLPTSPNRTFWVSQFLKQKLGDEKFEKVKELIDHSPNPTQLLKDDSEKVMEIIGEDKRDCLVMLSFLVSHSTNSVTPTGENKVRTSRPSQMDGRNIKCFKSPASANPFLRNIFPASNDPGSADRVNSQSKI